jgi:hypothetical protein
MDFLRTSRAVPLRRTAVAMVALLVSLALYQGNAFASGAGSSAACNTGSTATPDVSGQAFLDAGANNKVTYVCIASSEFPGGHSDAISANGTVGNGCYIVEGLGTSVVDVYWQTTALKPNCAMFSHIDVSTAAAPTTTATATATATAPAATATPTRPAPTATAPAATPTKTVAAPAPPNTGSGTSGSSSTTGIGALLVLFGILTLGGTAALVVSRARNS